MAEEKVPRNSSKLPTIVTSEYTIPNDSRNDIYAHYMRYMPVRIISQQTGVSIPVIRKLIKEGKWEIERKKAQKDIRTAVRMQELARLSSITHNGLMMVDGCLRVLLKKYKENKTAPSLAEARAIMTLVLDAFNMKASEGSGLTDSSDSITPDQVLEVFMNDPYIAEAMKNGKVELDAPKEENESDTIIAANSERSASQEARLSSERIEPTIQTEHGAVRDREAPIR